jgi:hypothetical protein
MSKQLPKPTEEEKHKYMTMTEALEFAENAGFSVTRPTIISWVDKKKLGFQPGGTDSNWWVYKDKFEAYVLEMVRGCDDKTATN